MLELLAAARYLGGRGKHIGWLCNAALVAAAPAHAQPIKRVESLMTFGAASDK